MYLNRIKIKNFRSLVDVDLPCSDYTAFVGANDSGKSNVLRALNLFFNGNTDIGQPLLFSSDYSQKAIVKKNKAEQIEIELHFQPPENYTDNDLVIWKKTWRETKSEPHTDTLRLSGNVDFSPRSKTEFWVRQIQFEYVPAIRGKEFFATLKRRLHNTLAATIAPRLESASGSFLKSIRTEVASIEREAVRLLELSTEFSLPSDLGSFFEILDLKTADQHAATPLQNRGDGIQGRHIPVILRFLADQRKTNFARGKPPPETIWGYEEPENNLELVKQVEEAGEFFRCSSRIQVLLTTHSPAFYGITRDNVNASSLFASRLDGATSFEIDATNQTIDRSLGLMPFIEPYLAHAMSDRSALLDELNQHRVQSLRKERNVLSVEGSTDKTVLDAVCERLFQGDLQFDIVTKPGMGAGVGWAVGYALARIAMPGVTAKTAILLDDDDAGCQAIEKLNLGLIALGRANQVKQFKIGNFKYDEDLRKVLQAGFILPVALEEVCGRDAWEHAEQRGWLEDRDDIVRLNAAKLTPSQSFSDLVDTRLTSVHEKRLLLKQVRGTDKGKFAKHVVETMELFDEIPPSLKKIALAILAYYGK